MGALKSLKSAARRMLVTRPLFNRCGRPLWRLVTIAKKPSRKQYPIVGSFPVRLPDGSSLTLYTAREDWLLTGLYWYGFDEGESAELSVFITLARDASTVLDIGANIGVYGIAVAKANPRAVVHAFEPLPSNLQTLRRVAQLNGCSNLQAHEVALSDHAGEARFYVPRHRMCNVRDGSLVAGFREDVDEVPVKLESLDSFTSRLNIGPIDLMKVDVETAEEFVLRGAQRVLTKDRPIVICEVLKGGQDSAVARIMKDAEYRFHWIGPEGLVQNDHLDADPEQKYRMYLMLPAEKVEPSLAKLRAGGMKIIGQQEPAAPR